MNKPKVLFYIAGSSLILFIVWLHLATTPNVVVVSENVIKETIQNFTDESEFARMSQTTKHPEDIKYMLVWNQRNLEPLNEAVFRDGQASFILNKCPNTNCYVTSDRNYFGGDITKFDAIAFNGRNAEDLPNEFPKTRSPHQKYIYFNMESADNIPACHPEFDNFFNWTATYRLDSDIPFTYLTIRKEGQIVGPDLNMDWSAELPEIGDYLSNFKKTKAAAWFVSHCPTRSKREDVVSNLQKALSEFGYSIDIYGSCGPLRCSRNNEEACNKKLEKDYYFYMSMENSFAEDYVTEKLLTALQHDVVPIVFGAANYSRFLPPNSYIDAQKHNAFSLATIMDLLIRSPSVYAEYYRWKQVYQYNNPQTTDNVCKLCAALNDKEKIRKNIYGSCGPLKCPRNEQETCNRKLEEDYYFYLSMENSFSEDYVTEKLLTALHHDVVPIVYGGADYSRFLPPNSYIDAKKYNASSLAILMDQLIRLPNLYAQYFKWKQVYEYISPETTINVCRVCTTLTDKEIFSKISVYKNFRKWWLGSDSFNRRC